MSKKKKDREKKKKFTLMWRGCSVGCGQVNFGFCFVLREKKKTVESEVFNHEILGRM